MTSYDTDPVSISLKACPAMVLKAGFNSAAFYNLFQNKLKVEECELLNFERFIL